MESDHEGDVFQSSDEEVKEAPSDPVDPHKYNPVLYDDGFARPMSCHHALEMRGLRGGQHIAVEKERGGERHPCPGYIGLRLHRGEHQFLKYDALRLQLRHRLNLRLVIAGSNASLSFTINFSCHSDFVQFSCFFFFFFCFSSTSKCCLILQDALP